MAREFKRFRVDRLSREQVLTALGAAAKQFKFVEFGKREFNDGKFGCSSNAVQRVFGSWAAGIEALREELAKSSQLLRARSRVFVTDDELFGEMERIWRLVGQRPSRYEWENHSPRYSFATYKRRFGGWQQACLSFIETRMGGEIDAPSKEDARLRPAPSTKSAKTRIVRKSIPLRVRLRVFDRDQFRCCSCGRSPATDVGVRLHIDHILPVSQGGAATPENLRTLCADCNLGRGDSSEFRISVSSAASGTRSRR